MQIKRDDLVKILEIVRSGLAKKDIVEGATQFVFSGKEVLTYNDRICVCHPFKTDFVGSVPADELLKVLSKIETPELELSKVTNESRSELVFESGKIKAGIVLSSGQEVLDKIKFLNYPLDNKWIDLPEKFAEGLSLCLFSVAKEVSTGLSNIFVWHDMIFSSDNLRISLFKLSRRMRRDFCLATSNVQELILFNFDKYFIDESWFYLKDVNGTIFCSRIISYPNINEIAQSVQKFFVFSGRSFTFPKSTKKLVESSLIFADGEFEVDKIIQVKLDHDKLLFCGRKEVGWIEASDELQPPVDFTIMFDINPVFFSQILERTFDVEIGDNKILFKSDNFKHLLMMVI